jgi:hypothetical protein
MKNKIEDLRNHLFAQLERLSDEEIDRAKLDKEVTRAASLIQVASVIIDSARAETEFLKATSEDANDSTGFFPIAKDQRKYFIEKS